QTRPLRGHWHPLAVPDRRGPAGVFDARRSRRKGGRDLRRLPPPFARGACDRRRILRLRQGSVSVSRAGGRLVRTAIVGGVVAGKPGNGGNVWSRLSFVEGLRRQGFETSLLEKADGRVHKAGVVARAASG